MRPMSRSFALAAALLLTACELVGGLFGGPRKVVLSTDLEPALLAPVLASVASPSLLVEVRQEASPSPGADLVWTAEPPAALERIAAGVTQPFKGPNPSVSRDPNGAWVGGAGRAIVLLVSDRRGDRRPNSIEDISNPRFRGRVAIPPLDGPLMSALRAALTETWGATRTNSLFADIQRNELAITPDEETAARFAAAGRVVFAVVGSDVAQRSVSGNRSVQMVVPDQDYDGLFFVPSLFTIPSDSKDPKAAEALAARLSVLPLTGRVAPRADLRLLAANTLTSWPPTPHVVASRAPASLPEAVPPVSTPPTEGP